VCLSMATDPNYTFRLNRPGLGGICEQRGPMLADILDKTLNLDELCSKAASRRERGPFSSCTMLGVGYPSFLRSVSSPVICPTLFPDVPGVSSHSYAI
jgi:hypothetical protein